MHYQLLATRSFILIATVRPSIRPFIPTSRIDHPLGTHRQVAAVSSYRESAAALKNWLMLVLK